MQAGPSPAREARLRHRHGVRTLSYVTLDQGNGGILLNVTRNGVAVQTVAAVRIGQQVQVRFELFAPRVRVNARGEVMWSTSSGRCGIRFLDLSAKSAHQLDEWTFAKLLEGASPLSHPSESVFAASRANASQPLTSESSLDRPRSLRQDQEEDLGEESDRSHPAAQGDFVNDHLIISPARIKVIDLPKPNAASSATMPTTLAFDDPASDPAPRLDWLSQPLSGRGLAWTVNGLVVTAAWLLFVLVFLSVLRDIPKWPGLMVTGAAVVVAALYWGFFRMFAGASLGVKLAQLARGQDQAEPEQNRFR
jgi:PilZ domain